MSASDMSDPATRGLEPWQANAKRNHDGPNGEHVPDIATCGHCGRSWDDALITGITPASSARCPFEFDHVYPDPKEEMTLAGLLEYLAAQDVITRHDLEGDDPELEESLAVLGLYPETKLHEINRPVIVVPGDFDDK